MNQSCEILQKSIAAALSAIEIYNKPSFHFREETFSILMTSAWELLLKAKVISDNGENLEAIIVYEEKSKPDGSSERVLKTGLL